MDVEDLRLVVYRTFAETGRAPSTPELATELDCSPRTVEAGLLQLGEGRHVVLGSAGEIVMAHPFSAVPLGFSVMGSSTLWWGGCAWDSFAMPHLLVGEPDMLVATRCPACDSPHAWNVGRDAPPPGEQVAHFLTPAAHMWDDVVHTCAHQRIFCSADCVEEWITATGRQRGYEMDLTTLWKLAAGWYAGRLDRGYRRRDPGSATDFLESAGLAGSFWGL